MLYDWHGSVAAGNRRTVMLQACHPTGWLDLDVRERDCCNVIHHDGEVTIHISQRYTLQYLPS
eukprot:9320128-Alexandrium_andersonii.AAC.1